MNSLERKKVFHVPGVTGIHQTLIITVLHQYLRMTLFFTFLIFTQQKDLT